uniref:Uncharacterized protein n=1 Tax=Anguilla anguilla TaxID=7936 RepID=A0A0E9WES3_ANGAN
MFFPCLTWVFVPHQDVHVRSGILPLLPLTKALVSNLELVPAPKWWVKCRGHITPQSSIKCIVSFFI